MKRLVIHIDRLVMKGLRREDASSITENLREHLTRELAAPETLQRILARGDVPWLQAGKVSISAGNASARIGERAAHAIAARVKP
jgi:hypothetical protein